MSDPLMISEQSVLSGTLLGRVILNWRDDECPKLPDVPYLLRTTRGPVIAEWSQEHQSWREWLGGEHYGTGVNCQVTGWLDIPPT